jgi:Protein of unknown function (DUF2800)
MSTREHAVIAPSKLHRIVPCPGSVTLERPFDSKPQSEAAAEGDAGHFVAWCAVLYAMKRIDALPVVGDKCPNGLAVDQDMLDGAEMYVDALEGFDGTAETRVEIPRVHEKCFGTPDFWQWNPATKTLRVTDYKYGRRYVEVFENYQLAAYACGLIDQLNLNDQDLIVEFLLVQPRCYHPDGPVREWRTSGTRLRPLVNICASAADEALGPNPKTKTGGHCVDCTAAAVCKTLHIAGQSVLEFSGEVEAMACNADEVGVRLAQIVQARDLLKALADGLEEQALGMIRLGKSVTNWGIDFTKPRQNWNVPVATVKALGEMYGVALTEETFAMTPKQAIKRKIPEAIINKVSVTPTGTPKLTLDSTVRTRKIFNK